MPPLQVEEARAARHDLERIELRRVVRSLPRVVKNRVAVQPEERPPIEEHFRLHAVESNDLRPVVGRNQAVTLKAENPELPR